MITKDTHKVDWNKTAQVAGVLLVGLARGTWWLGKKIGLLLIAVMTIVAKMFVAVLAVSASNSTNGEDDEDIRQIKSCDDNGCDLSTGLPIKNRF